jgi:hypothetical protein
MVTVHQLQQDLWAPIGYSKFDPAVLKATNSDCL